MSPGQLSATLVRRHLAAAAGRDVPDYATAIDRLAELGVLPGEFARTRRFRAIAGFRNVLVHGYLDVDPAVVHRILDERLDDFRAFARHVEAHLAAAGGVRAAPSPLRQPQLRQDLPRLPLDPPHVRRPHAQEVWP